MKDNWEIVFCLEMIFYGSLIFAALLAIKDAILKIGNKDSK